MLHIDSSYDISWVEQDITTIFNSTDNYLKGEN